MKTLLLREEEPADKISDEAYAVADSEHKPDDSDYKWIDIEILSDTGADAADFLVSCGQCKSLCHINDSFYEIIEIIRHLQI